MESLNLAHVHLLLNHFPTIGFGIALCIYLGAFLSKSDLLKRVGLVVFFLVALGAIPTYMTGGAAERHLCPELKCPETISPAFIRIHEDWALLAFALMEMTGFFAWLALWQFRKSSKVPSWNWTVVLLLAVASWALMARAAAMGGEIRHPEVRSVAEITVPAWQGCASVEGI